MFDIFDLLTITWRFFQSFDHQSGSRWNDVNLCLTILNSQFNGYPQPFPVLSGLGDIVTNFLGRQTKWTNFGSQGRGSCYFSSNGFSHDNLDFIRIEFRRHFE